MVEDCEALKSSSSPDGIASSTQVGLCADRIPVGRWLRVQYRTALYGSAARPVIRFDVEGKESQEPMGSAFFGTGEWIGLVPQGTRRIHIALPAGCPATDFSLTSCEVLTQRELLTLAWKRGALKTIVAMGSMLVGAKVSTSGLLKDLFGATRLERYHEWRATGSRGLDLAGLEAPRDSWRQGPHIRAIVLADRSDSGEALGATFDSLARQSYPNWSLAVVGPDGTYRGDRSVVHVEGNARSGALWEGLEASDIVFPIVAGDTIADYAMAALVEFASVCPAVSLFYADEDSIDANRRHVAPELKPDWSPIFHRGQPYVGRAVYFRRRALEARADLSSAEMLRPSTWDALFAAETGPVGHIRRVLLTKSRKSPEAGDPITTAMPVPQGATATLIVPTRDRADLLAACLAGLEKTEPRTFELLILDNGSREPATRDLFERARAHAWVKVVEAPGPFNFSTLCNRGAELARGRVLVFLNNDTEAMRPDWLTNLMGWAMRPDVGAVGARLLYPSGRLQHAGLVLGLGGYAAHIDVGSEAAYKGYLDRLRVPHEVSAVTGACLAVEKSKFDAIGGFDAERYPIELGDIDLCLRLAQRGWKTVFTPDAVLTHHESATRGRSNVAERYAKERQHFLASWKDAVLDDPCFHPALSLTARRTSLDH